MRTARANASHQAPAGACGRSRCTSLARPARGRRPSAKLEVTGAEGAEGHQAFIRKERAQLGANNQLWADPRIGRRPKGTPLTHSIGNDWCNRGEIGLPASCATALSWATAAIAVYRCADGRTTAHLDQLADQSPLHCPATSKPIPILEIFLGDH